MENERSELFGHIYKRRKEGRELPFWWVCYRVNGKRHRESTKSTDRRKAETLLARRHAELGLGAFTAPDVQRTTLVQLADMLRANYKINGRRSLRRTETSLKHLLEFFGATYDDESERWSGGAKAVAVTADQIAAYICERQEAGVAPATIRNELMALKAMFKLGIRARKVTAAQRPEIPTIQLNNARQGFFEEADFQALLRELPEHLRPVMEFAYYTGWRVPSEVLTLRWTQVDMAAKIVRLEVGTTKNREGRTFPFTTSATLAALLQEQRDRVRTLERELGRIVPLVFPGPDGGPIGRFDKSWKSALRRAAHDGTGTLKQLVRPQLIGRIPHDLRRTAVRNLVRAGVPEKTAMQLTGHKTRAVFDRYDIVNEADLANGVAKLEALHSGQPATRRPHSAAAGR